MGKLFEEFGSLTYHNEAEVSQNFILPLVQKYLGYKLTEIVPERNFPAAPIYSGVNFNSNGSKGLTHRPDYVICLIGDTNQPKFIIDSKSPSEDIDLHLGQLRSYANSVGRNFLMITNGTKLKVYDVNNLIFHSEDIADLQLKVEQLVALLGRENQILMSDIEILKAFDFATAIGQREKAVIDEGIKRVEILLSDFKKYLHHLSGWVFRRYVTPYSVAN